MANQRRQGHTFEREVVNLLKSYFPNEYFATTRADSRKQDNEGNDIINPFGFRIQCKKQVVTGKNVDKEDLYSVRAVIGGLFEIIGDEEIEIEECLNINCASILFPYLRQEVDNIIHFSGFPPFIIQPISFYDIYENKKAKN